MVDPVTYTPGGGALADGSVTTAKLASDVVAAIDAKAPVATTITTADARLTDARTPTAHTHLATGISDSTGAGRTVLTAVDDAAQRTALGLGTLATQSGTFSGTSSGTNTGDNATNTLYSGLVTNATHTGDVTGSGALTIANDAVTYAKMQNVSAADRLLGRGNGGGAGDVQELTLGTNLSLSGTTLNAAAGGGAGDLVYVAAGADVAINSTTDITVVTRDVTGVGTTDKIEVVADFTISNNSTATRVYVLTLDFDGLFDVEFTTGALATSATLAHPFTMRAVLDIRSIALSYATFVCEGQLAAGIASGTDTTMAATHLRAQGWGTSVGNLTGTCTVALFIRSANATAIQTCRLHNFQIRKATPT